MNQSVKKQFYQSRTTKLKKKNDILINFILDNLFISDLLRFHYDNL
jgi:hypothetical protein